MPIIDFSKIVQDLVDLCEDNEVMKGVIRSYFNELELYAVFVIEDTEVVNVYKE